MVQRVRTAYALSLSAPWLRTKLPLAQVTPGRFTGSTRHPNASQKPGGCGGGLTAHAARIP